MCVCVRACMLVCVSVCVDIRFSKCCLKFVGQTSRQHSESWKYWGLEWSDLQNSDLLPPLPNSRPLPPTLVVSHLLFSAKWWKHIWSLQIELVNMIHFTYLIKTCLFGLAVKLVSRRASAWFRFGSPLTSERLWFVDTVLWLGPSQWMKH